MRGNGRGCRYDRKVLSRWIWPGFALLAAIAIVASTLFTIVQSYTPGYKDEQWMFLHGFEFWDLIFSQHSEHKLPLAKFFGFCDVWFARADNRLLFTLIQINQWIHAGFLLWLLRRWTLLTWAELAFPAACVTVALFHPRQWENFTWGFQIQFVMAFLFASVAIAGLVGSQLDPDGKHDRWLWLALAGAALGTFDLANGVLLWPLLGAGLLVYRAPLRTWAIFAVSGALTLGAFFYNWHPVKFHGIPWENLRTPLPVARYWIRYFGSTWDALGYPMLVGDALAALAGVTLLVLGVRFLRGPRRVSVERAFLLWSATFLAATGLVTALGRVRFGLEQAAISRYQTPALLFWLMLGLLVWLRWRDGRWTRPVLALALLAVAGVTWVRLGAITSGAYEWQARVERSLAAVYAGVLDDEDLPGFGTNHGWVRQALPEIREKSWMGYGSRESRYPKVIPAQRRCTGQVETRRLVDGRLRVAGWTSEVALQVGTANANGKFSGFGAGRIPRPDRRDVAGFVAFPAREEDWVVIRTPQGWCALTGIREAQSADLVTTVGSREGWQALWLPGDASPEFQNARLRTTEQGVVATATNSDEQLIFTLRRSLQEFRSVWLEVEMSKKTDGVEFYFGGDAQRGAALAIEMSGRFFIHYRIAQNPYWQESTNRLRFDPGGFAAMDNEVTVKGIWGERTSEPSGLPVIQLAR